MVQPRGTRRATNLKRFNNPSWNPTKKKKKKKTATVAQQKENYNSKEGIAEG
jgi:hypothetical protein